MIPADEPIGRGGVSAVWKMEISSGGLANSWTTTVTCYRSSLAEAEMAAAGALVVKCGLAPVEATAFAAMASARRCVHAVRRDPDGLPLEIELRIRRRFWRWPMRQRGTETDQ